MEHVPDAAWVDAHIEEAVGFPRPDWEAILDRIEGTAPADRWGDVLDDVVRRWLGKVAGRVGHGARVLESRNFLLLVPPRVEAGEVLLRFLEHALRTVRTHLPGIARDDGYGRHVVLVFDSDDDYYGYVDWFHPPGGSYPFTGGMFLQGDFQHIVLRWAGMAGTESAAAHELTHACLAHLEIPPWLNEGMAQVMEGIATGGSALHMSIEVLGKHRSYWNDRTIQLLWSGRSFHLPIDGFSLGYGLGYHMVKSLTRDLDRFRAFVLRARSEDAGEAALREVFGRGLGELAGSILGPGEWGPRPETWDALAEEPVEPEPGEPGG